MPRGLTRADDIITKCHDQAGLGRGGNKAPGRVLKLHGLKPRGSELHVVSFPTHLHHVKPIHDQENLAITYVHQQAAMGPGSKIALVGLRIWQLMCSVLVLGILASFLHRISNAGATRDGRVVYGIVTASISTVFSIVFIAPFLYAFLAFPADFILFVMWLVVFCLLVTVRAPHCFIHAPRPWAQADLLFSAPAPVHAAPRGFIITGAIIGADGGGRPSSSPGLPTLRILDAASGGRFWPSPSWLRLLSLSAPF